MSSHTRPISSERFAEALQELPLSTLHNTAAEIRNSKAHLQSSNLELNPHAEAGDAVCKEAIQENEQVMERMDGRLKLLKTEVERRGMPWVEEEMEVDGAMNGHAQESSEGNDAGSGSLSDDELRRQMEARLRSAEHTGDGDDGDDDDGVHL